MMKNLLLSTCLILGVAALSFADVIILKSGKTLEAKIIEYSADEGLVIESDYGTSKIPISKVSNFVISEIKEEGNTLLNSEFHKLGLTIDTTLLEGYEVGFDVNVGEVGEVLIYLMDSKRGAGLMLTMEPMGIENNEYFNLLEKVQKENFTEFTETELTEGKHDHFETLTKDYHAKVQGYQFIYRTHTWIFNNYNYRTLYWTLDIMFEKISPDLDKIIASIKPIEK
jgi:hypothetical protein